MHYRHFKSAECTQLYTQIYELIYYLSHLFCFLLAEFQYLDKSYVDVLLSAAVEGAVIIDSNSEHIDTSSNLNWFSSGEIPDLGTLKVTPNKSFHIFKNFYLREFSRMDFLRARAPFDFLYKYRRKKCSECLLYDPPTKWNRAKVRRPPFYDQLKLRF